ncbi:MAG: DsbA family protein [Marinovum sp.]|nr:DsbA family protein [Marinovum sp.]
MNKWIPILAAALILAGAGGWWYNTKSTITDTTKFELATGAANAQEAASEGDASPILEMTMGADDAPVTVIEYASYTCPHCATFHASTFKNLKADYIDTGKVRFVYREVYFDRFGLWASMIARCGGPERFFGITDLLYSGQSTWSRAGDPASIADELRKIGRLAGLDSEGLEACLSDGAKAQALVAWFEENAQRDGISSTPSFMIDGELFSNMSYSEFQRILDEKIDG